MWATVRSRSPIISVAARASSRLADASDCEASLCLIRLFSLRLMMEEISPPRAPPPAKDPRV
ncbi:hypothetical protein [Proteiniphilum propionicum]|uniref:hypothetical protein n=1 Tax=Proteiniphilum propionicum TaxID=2829812 RepID=UPI001EEC2C2F|nr:hypothetical protein [Proteiniphilum propionicum]ULB35490.1 hypothetical protein KDN43_05490 [Proteiniphilum propionicum]